MTHLKIMFDNNDFNINNDLRVELLSKPAIQTYCKKNDLNGITDMQYMIKKKAKDKEGNEIDSIDKKDYNLRYTYHYEEVLSADSEQISNLLEHIADLKKIFRYIHRLSFTKEGLPLRIDLSRVKTNKQSRGRLLSANDIKSSGLFKNDELFEIEIEVIDHTDPNLLNKIKSSIKLVLSALQQTNYPARLPPHNSRYYREAEKSS